MMRGGATLRTMSDDSPSLSDRLGTGVQGPTDPYRALRLAGQAWAGGGGGDADTFGETVLALEPLLAPSYLLDQPNVAGMGVGAWDTGGVEPMVDPERAIRRMVRGGRLARLFEDDEAEPEDEEASGRAADLVEAMQRLERAAGKLPDAAPEAVRDGLASLRQDLRRRLQLEQRHNPKLGEIDPTDPDAVARLRALAPVRAAVAPAMPRASRGPSLYADSPERDVARAPAVKKAAGAPPEPEAADQTTHALVDRIAKGDTDGVAAALKDERRTLDGAMREKLASFFGHDFADVMVFAGPMAGALARSIDAEAFTHGQMVFFDPKHYRLDTAQGEALVAHELAHTRQQDDRDARTKEAEALATEAAYLDWLHPGGAPLAEENPLDPNRPDAAIAADVAGGFQRATAARKGQKGDSEGPRGDIAAHEAKVKQVLERVRQLLDQDHDIEGQRVGRLDRIFSGPF